MAADKKRKKVKAAAVLTVFDAEDFSPSGARSIAAWLRRQADNISKAANRRALAPRYTARYLY